MYIEPNSRAVKEAATVPNEDKKRAAHQALVASVLTGQGQASTEQRANAFRNDGLAPPLDGLISKVNTRPVQVTEADFAAARAAGYNENQLFELVICAAVGQSTRLFEAGLAALNEELVEQGRRHAT
jgi:hypothetical protein